MLDRVVLIPFLARFSKDRSYIDNLVTNHLDEIASYLFEGASLWYKHGLVKPKICNDEMGKYIQVLDSFSQFINDCCERGSSDDHYVFPNDLFTHYDSWCTENHHINKLSSVKFGQRLKKEFGEKKQLSKKYNRKVVTFGLKLL